MARSIPCIAYAAKSSPDEKDATATQLAEVRAAVERTGGRSVVSEFSEQNVSGFKGERGPKLEAALAAAKLAAEEHGEAELWVWHTSRLSRGDGTKGHRSLNLIHAQLLYEGVQLRSVHDDEFVRSPMLVGIASEQNHKYSRDLSTWVKGGKDRQMQAGIRLGGPAPDGLRPVYAVDARGRKQTSYERDAERASIIERIFVLSESGMGDGSIARALNRDGLRTQAGRPWSRRRVQDTVTNQSYAGRVVRFRGKPNEEVTVATNMPTLINPARFDAINAARAKRDRSASGRARAKGGRPTVRYALSRLAECDRCGSPMRCITTPYKRKDGTQAKYYFCSQAKDCTGICDAPRVPAELADAALLPYLRGFFCDFDGWLARVANAEAGDRDALAVQLDDQRTKLATLTRSETGAQDRWAKALADDDQQRVDALEAAMARIGSERKQVAASIADLEATLAEVDHAAKPVDRLLDFWNALSDGINGKLDNAQTIAEVNEALREVLASVRIGTLPDGRVQLQAVFDERDEWWDDETSWAAAGAPPAYPNTVVARTGGDPVETERNFHGYRSTHPSPGALAASHG